MSELSLSFVLPMFNEAEGIESTIAKIDLVAKELCNDYEIIIVDDASTDASADIVARAAGKNERLSLIRLKENTKFGGALAKGLYAASKDFIVYTDSDFPIREKDVEHALRLFDRGADVINGYSLALKDSSIRRIIVSKVYNLLVQTLFGFSIRDINSGFKIYRKEVLVGITLRSKSPFIDVEIFAEILRRGFKVAQYGLLFQLRTKGASTISRPSVIMRTFFDMIRYRFFR
ncbi:MAG: glycosyltransferase family 2 protein [Candidatus Omnitrophota bacterium]